MKQVRLFLLLIILFATALVANAQIQTQRGGHTAVLSEDGGKFEIAMPTLKAVCRS